MNFLGIRDNVRSNFKWLFLVILLLISITLWATTVHEDRKGVLKVVFLDIGQGNSTLIESPTGTQIIVDGGPNKNLIKTISSFLPWYDRKVDMIIASHPDKDHYEGFISFLNKYSVDVFMEPGVLDIPEGYKILKQEIIDKKIPVVLARRGQIVDIGGGAYIEIIFPDRDVSGFETNTASIVLKVVYGSTSMIIQGDSPQSIEHYLVSLNKEALDSDLIEVGHHGSKTSSSDEYIKAVSPDFAIISAAKNNSYGHPNKETLEVLEKEKVPILGTYDLGNIIFISDGSVLRQI